VQSGRAICNSTTHKNNQSFFTPRVHAELHLRFGVIKAHVLETVEQSTESVRYRSAQPHANGLVLLLTLFCCRAAGDAQGGHARCAREAIEQAGPPQAGGGGDRGGGRGDQPQPKASPGFLFSLTHAHTHTLDCASAGSSATTEEDVLQDLLARLQLYAPHRVLG
jgi:hypothetical protein